jgi:hypothetical protein
MEGHARGRFYHEVLDLAVRANSSQLNQYIMMKKIRSTSLWMELDNRTGTSNSVLGNRLRRWPQRTCNLSKDSVMTFQHRAVGRDTCAQIRALTREGGEQDCAASLDACKPGVTAYGFSNAIATMAIAQKM